LTRRAANTGKGKSMSTVASPGPHAPCWLKGKGIEVHLGCGGRGTIEKKNAKSAPSKRNTMFRERRKTLKTEGYIGDSY